MNLTCTWQFAIVADDPSTLPAEVDAIMQHLLQLEDSTLQDSAIGLDLDAMQLDISVTVHSETQEAAIAHGMSAIRAAIHAAGGSTPDWGAAPTNPGKGLQLLPGQLVAA